MNKRQPLILMMTDDHLKDSSTELSLSIHRQARQAAKSLGLTAVHHTGDIIDSRKSQSWSVLKTMIRILREYEDDEMQLIIIPGNHDKPDYESEESFLDVFDRYPAMQLVRSYGRFMVGKGLIHMVPFFDEVTTYPRYLKKAVDGISDHAEFNVLLTHVGVNGVRRNDGTNVENGLKENVFSKFDLVFIGHYHDYQEVGNVVYYGSTHQHNFGEDDEKGVTVLYDDLSFDQIKLDTPRYRTHVIDANVLDDQAIKKAISNKEDADFHKFKFTGTKERMTAITNLTKDLKLGGCKVEKVVDDPDVDLSYEELMDFKGFDKSSILEEWDAFAEKKQLDPAVAASMKSQLQTILQS